MDKHDIEYDLFGQPTYKIPILERDILTDIFINTMKDIDENDLINILYSLYEAIIDYSKLCNGEKTGEKISMLFNPHRYSTPTKNGDSIIESFKKNSFLNGLARATLFKESKCKELLYQVLQLGINGAQYVNEFPPYIARKLYIDYKVHTIIDPCAGWGGRMIGAASIGAFYYGFEPSYKTYNGLCKLGEFLKLFKNGFDYRIENIPFEDAIINKRFDMAFTSPPYYDTELYTDEITNSCNRYKTFDCWINGFYIPMIKKTMLITSIFVLNIGNRRYNLKDILINNYPNTYEIDGYLSGISGLGRDKEGKESFYRVI